ncbi:MAG: 2-oxo-hepta-3-ene-1,7-dioic acid hydratase [Actinomycetota bacterium]|nr:2-oxo-hepta-3-ene-1,7-dioic acid hydratase [Actinomycetota bacterium]
MRTLTDEEVTQQAARHEEARVSATQIDPVTVEHPDMTIEDAYAIQKAWFELETAAGSRLRGHKIGLTSRAMQNSMNIDEPDYGYLLDYMFHDDGCDLDTSAYCDPKIEVELAFVIGKQLEGPDVTMFDVLSATDYVVPAIELIDARSYRKHPVTGATRTVCDTISDNAADAGVILGGRPVTTEEVDLRWVGALCYRNGVIEESGVAAAVLNHPANGVAWLARRYALHGMALEPGQVILGGSFTRPVDCRAGDTFHVDYGGLGGVGFHFS